MLIGIPKESKNNEFRVSVSPKGTRELIFRGHNVIVQTGAGSHIGYEDIEYKESGATVVETKAEVFEKAEMIVKVKEPQLSECALIREGQVIFCYLHLAATPKVTKAIIESKGIAIAYETITADDGSLPLLAPMSEIAGRMAVQAGANCLEYTQKGQGILLGGVPGVSPANVVILGGGVAGTNAAMLASAMGAQVTLLDNSIKKIREIDWNFQGRIRTIFSNLYSVEKYVNSADLVIATVLVPGSETPKIITEEMVRSMKKGSAIVDVSIDQGGCCETSVPTTHDDPTYVREGVVHYCVTNMPSAVARNATRALENSTLPYILNLADNGYRNALKEDENFKNGLNIYRGRITHEAIARDLNHSYVPASTFLSDRM